MKGIILAGGSGTRLYPITKAVSKQLLPVYDKPMIYYPLSVLMLAGIKDILIITTKEDYENYSRLLKDGKQLGINIIYKIQDKPDGIGSAFIIGEDFIGNDRVCLILGDNIFWGQGFSPILKEAVKNDGKAVIFGYKVKDPNRFGIVDIDSDNVAISIEEKPKNPKSNLAVTGLYFYDSDVVLKAKQSEPSARGELEITSINQLYLEEGNLDVKILGRGFAWVDTGTHRSLTRASMLVETIENSQGFKIACLEEIALQNNWIAKEDVYDIYKSMESSQYGQYLKELLDE